MGDQISKIQFDICILGCGAYGLPLVVDIIGFGKKYFHIGGGLQFFWHQREKMGCSKLWCKRI
jgi:hypothetical protein